MTRTNSFPEGFRWGTATAAHQIEGGNWNNDWWAWEHAGGRAVGRRASAIAHYRRQCEALLERGIDPDYQAVDGGEATRDAARALMEDPFLEASVGDDFIGVQTYSRSRCGPHGQLGPERGVEVLALGYEYWPESLGATIRRAWDVTKGVVPIRVTENGIGTADDTQRIRYLHAALDGVLDCLADGIEVTGYTCWSLLDNFEWAFGYGPHFGLVEVDRVAPFARRPKPSAEWYGRVITANALVP